MTSPMGSAIAFLRLFVVTISPPQTWHGEMVPVGSSGSLDEARISFRVRSICSRVSVGVSVRDGDSGFFIFILPPRSEEHTSELQSRFDLVCRLLLEKKKKEVAVTRTVT